MDDSTVDQTAMRLLGESRSGQFLARIGAACDDAWRHSVARRIWTALVAPWAAAGPEERVRAVAWSAASAAAAALLLQPLSPDPTPLMWMFPAAVAAAAVVVLIGSHLGRWQ